MFNIKPVFNFKATTFFNAFILNAICASLTALAAIKLHDFGNKRKENCEKGKIIHLCHFYKKSFYKNLSTFIGTFLTTISVYCLMNILFGYGGGMLA